MLQAAVLDCGAFDPFSFQQDGLPASEVDVGGREVFQALVIALVIIVFDEPADAGFEIARQVVVLQQDAVLQRLMPAFDLALCLRMIGRATSRRSSTRRASSRARSTRSTRSFGVKPRTPRCTARAAWC